MRSRRLHSRRSASTAALLFFAIAAMLAAHLDAGSRAPVSARSYHHIMGAASRRAHANYLANRRGLRFGVPRNAYGSAVAAMRAMERRAIQNLARRMSAARSRRNGPRSVRNRSPMKSRASAELRLGLLSRAPPEGSPRSPSIRLLRVAYSSAPRQAEFG